ncbi:MAG: ATP-binding cassette domain-containing protein [Anaerolineae bacterium]|nr:ATP-binding cassette domain-containing protein [Anaerolineae bacterium]
MVSPTKAIEVERISKRYGQYIAVDDLSFDVYRGEIFSMLGPNGAGKTSTIRMILDIIKPDSGMIAVLGGPFTEATKERIGYLPEERGLYKGTRVVELLAYLGTLKGMSHADATRRASQLLDDVGLGENKKSKVSELSRGMSQKVQFIATIIHDPELIMIDEPFSGLDPVNTEMIKNLIYQFKAQGKTIVMSIHEMHQVEEMADRLLMINHGKRVLYGSVDEVRHQFSENAVRIEGEGDWSRLPGIRAIKPDEAGRSVTLLLGEGTTPDDIMQAIAVSPNFKIRSFALALPSLNDIFIRVAGGDMGSGSNHREAAYEPAQNLAHR